MEALENLTADQQSTLNDYIAITNASIEDAIPILTRCQWNLQVSKSEPNQDVS